MNRITKKPIDKLGYNFIDKKFIPEGQDKYSIRNKQNKHLFGKERTYRHLSAREIETLVQNNNTSDDWNKLLVTDAFNPDRVKGCHFFGLVRIGKLEPYFLEFHNLRIPVGLYNSTICSCDFGDNVVIDNVNFIANHIIGNESMLVNINELSTSPYARFGNGITKEGGDEEWRVWLEVCNENGGRKILPFEGMLPGDALLWSKYRGDKELMDRFFQFTNDQFDLHQGYYGEIGDRSVIKNSKMIKDCKIGNDVYIKGVNKLKNLTIRSSENSVTQIGEGCELVNGIIGYGCRVFYGVKAVRFVMADYSNLKYGARLINSYLGSNATISCCEVLNSLIFPAHEQHHNNSFLCAALIMGQSNMAAGATIGSNHNSRGADGEIVAGRGFWPGLCVSLKHNSKFASFILIAKGDFPAEINLPIPFSLLSNDVSEDKLIIMPGYWFIYNMYALTRNAWKYGHRDKRKERTQQIEYDYLAPDSIEEMFVALHLMEQAVGKSYLKSKGQFDHQTEKELGQLGKQILTTQKSKLKDLSIQIEGIENSKRVTELIKVEEAYPLFKEMIFYYGMTQLVNAFQKDIITDIEELQETLSTVKKSYWVNVGGQLIREKDLQQMKTDIKEGRISNWQEVHQRYTALGKHYPQEKMIHALEALLRIKEINPTDCNKDLILSWLEETKTIAGQIQEKIEISRKKDYHNPFRNQVYENEKEMEAIVGSFEDNQFIQESRQKTTDFIQSLTSLKTKFTF